MPMVSSVHQVAAYQVCSHPASVCLVDHVLHGDYPDVMTFAGQRRTVAYYSTYVCVCLTSLPGVAPQDRASLTSDRRS